MVDHRERTGLDHEAKFCLWSGSKCGAWFGGGGGDSFGYRKSLEHKSFGGERAFDPPFAVKTFRAKINVLDVCGRILLAGLTLAPARRRLNHQGLIHAISSRVTFRAMSPEDPKGRASRVVESCLYVSLCAYCTSIFVCFGLFRAVGVSRLLVWLHPRCGGRGPIGLSECLSCHGACMCFSGLGHFQSSAEFKLRCCCSLLRHDACDSSGTYRGARHRLLRNQPSLKENRQPTR